MWNRNRCRTYSSIVQIKLPTKKQIMVFMIAVVVIKWSRERGSRGAAANGGRGLENCTRERMKR
jgi:hypothetical protein